jgi:hypothetical protein
MLKGIQRIKINKLINELNNIQKAECELLSDQKETID